MSILVLLLETAGQRTLVPVEVEANDFVGTCVASLVERFRYPRVDMTGRPVSYQLRQVTSTYPLPNTVRFRDAHLPPRTHVALEAEEANFATIPVGMSAAPLARPVSQSVPGRWTRRAFLFWTGASVSVLGTTAGFSTAFAQRYLSGHAVAPVSRTGSQPIPSVSLKGARKQFTFTPHTQTVRTVQWSPDSTLIASGGDDAQAFIWRAATGQVQQHFVHPAPVRTLGWSPEGQRLVSGAGTQITFYNVLTGVLLSRSTHQHISNVSSVAWTPQNQMQVVSGGMDKRAIVWETGTYQPQATFAGHDTSIEAVSWESQGQLIASASLGGAIRIWNATTLQETHGFFQDAQVPIRACAFAPRGTSLAAGGDDGVIRVWNGVRCQQQHLGNDGLLCQDSPLRLTTSTSPILALAWSSDDRYLASGGDDGLLRVWSPAHSHNPLFTISLAPENAIHSLAWSPENDQIVAASSNRVTLWKLQFE